MTSDSLTFGHSQIFIQYFPDKSRKGYSSVFRHTPKFLDRGRRNPDVQLLETRRGLFRSESLQDFLGIFHADSYKEMQASGSIMQIPPSVRMERSSL